MQRLEKILVQKAPTKVPESPSFGNFRKVTQNPHFLKQCKGGPRKIFQKIAQKRALAWKAQQYSGENGVILYLACTYSAKTGENLGAKSSYKSSRIAKFWQFSQSHPKPAFSETVQRGDQEKLFKNRPKTSPGLKGQKARWRRKHYPLISILLECKHMKKFWHKEWLQKGPNSQVRAIFARSTKTRIFLKSANGEARETFQKSPKKYPSFERPKSTLAQIALSSN